MHTENPLSPRGQEVYIEKSVFFLCLFVFVLLCFVVVAFFFFYENATLKRGGEVGGWGKENVVCNFWIHKPLHFWPNFEQV